MTDATQQTVHAAGKAASRGRAGEADRQDRARAAPLRGARPARARSIARRAASGSIAPSAVKRVEWIASCRTRLLAARAPGAPARRGRRTWRSLAMERVREVFADRLRETREQIERLDAARARSRRQPGVPRQLPLLRARAHQIQTSAVRCNHNGHRTARADPRRRDSSRITKWPLKLPIYMDNHATTPVDPRVLEAMLPYFTEHFGNAASRSHAFGWDGRGGGREGARAGRRADRRAARKEIVFTSRRDRVEQPRDQGRRRVLQGEGQPHHHRARPSTRRCSTPASASRRRASRSPTCRVDKDGLVDPDDVRDGDHRQDDPRLDHARQQRDRRRPADRRDRRDRASEKGVLFHTDAVQGVGKVPFDVNDAEGRPGVASSAHKMYGPKGVGALYVRAASRACASSPQIDGGGHERGMRSGTLNVPGIVGFGKAARAVPQPRWPPRASALRALRERLHERAHRRSSTRSTSTARWSTGCRGNLNISFAYVEGEALMMAHQGRRGVVGLGLHLGQPRAVATCCARSASATSWRTRSIRFGLGRFNTEEEVDYVVDLVIKQGQQAARDVAAVRDGARKASTSRSIQWAAH